MAGILDKLQGGDLRSIGRADEVVSDILHDNALFGQVFNGMFDVDPVIRMRAADAVEKVTRSNSEWLLPFKKRILDEASQIDQQEVRWHLAQMFPRLAYEQDELERIIGLLQKWIESGKSQIVRVNSMQALSNIAERYTQFKPLVIHIIQESVANGSPAVVSRGKKLIRKLGM